MGRLQKVQAKVSAQSMASKFSRSTAPGARQAGRSHALLKHQRLSASAPGLWQTPLPDPAGAMSDARHARPVQRLYALAAGS